MILPPELINIINSYDIHMGIIPLSENNFLSSFKQHTSQKYTDLILKLLHNSVYKQINFINKKLNDIQTGSSYLEPFKILLTYFHVDANGSDDERGVYWLFITFFKRNVIKRYV